MSNQNEVRQLREERVNLDRDLLAVLAMADEVLNRGDRNEQVQKDGRALGAGVVMSTKKAFDRLRRIAEEAEATSDHASHLTQHLADQLFKAQAELGKLAPDEHPVEPTAADL